VLSAGGSITAAHILIHLTHVSRSRK